jgi:hypothetical protein
MCRGAIGLGIKVDKLSILILAALRSPLRWKWRRLFARCRQFRHPPEAERPRAGVHATRGPISINDFVTLMAWHDDNHLDQLKRAIEGKA